jgi:hypothetical protein
LRIHSVSRMEADKTHADKVIGLQSRVCSEESICAGRRLEEAGSGHEDSSHNILTLDALQVLSGPR